MDALSQYIDTSQLKSMIATVKNAVLNYSEIQAKTDEATNGDHWGASSTLMNELANATNNPIHLNEIFDIILKKLLESGSNWRQCYKALQLLEYLVKNGSQRVVDRAKDHVYDLKALKGFFYTDEKNKDQGINVRNRAKEILELLADDNKIRDERKKAKENKQKYTGVSSTTSRYGGFSNESSNNYSSNNYSSNSSGYRDQDSSLPPSAQAPAAAPAAVIPKVQVVDKIAEPNLLDMDDNPKSSHSAQDDFSDFQSAPAPASNASKSMPAFAFQSAPVQSVNQQQGFAQFNSSVNQQGFANFNAPPVQQQSQGFANFNHVHQQPQGFAQQPQGFANFNQPAPQVFNQPAQGFASFNQSTTSFNQAQGFTQPQQPQGFAQPSQQGIANFKPPQFNNQQTTLQTSLSTPIKSKDAFSNLVSLDAMSLSSNAKKQQVGGPSLNSIQTSVSNAAFGYGNVVSPGVLASPVKGVQPNMGNQGGNFDSLI